LLYKRVLQPLSTSSHVQLYTVFVVFSTNSLHSPSQNERVCKIMITFLLRVLHILLIL